jgi:methionyl-tRNA synthetase
MKEKFYITTAIDYVNAPPHIGHAYQKIIADVLARWNRFLGKEVLFVTGTDEHGKKVQDSAVKAGKDVRIFVNEISNQFKDAWKSLDIEPDRFIRTTDEDHGKVVKDFIMSCFRNGDIYEGEYEGYYCVGCENYITEKDLVEGECPLHPGKKVEKIKEESYFFKLSKYQNFLLKLYEEHPEFILPAERRNEVINRVKEGLRDLSITRTNFDWGIPFALNEEHVTYVWFDALINYYSATREKGRELFWGEPTVHLLGKDNTWFHTVYWPAMLKSAGIDLPKTTLNHGFLKFNSQKISKSLGNAISPKILVEKYGADSIRYFVCRHFPFASGNDGDFNEKDLVNRHNGELLNKLGNLISRVSGLIEKSGISRKKNEFFEEEGFNLAELKDLFDDFEIDKVLNKVFSFIDRCNEYVQEKKLWESKNQEILYELADSIKKISIILYPFIPSSSKKISEKFGGWNFSLKDFNEPLSADSVIKKGEGLFERLDYSQIEKKEKINKSEKIEGVMSIKEVDFGDWEKLDLRVAEIESVEDIEGADKLYKLNLNVGVELGKRVICAGIKQYYSKENLVGKRIVYFSNLKPRKMRGIESQGMLLAASTENHEKVVLISPEKEIELGSRVG